MYSIWALFNLNWKQGHFIDNKTKQGNKGTIIKVFLKTQKFVRMYNICHIVHVTFQFNIMIFYISQP